MLIKLNIEKEYPTGAIISQNTSPFSGRQAPPQHLEYGPPIQVGESEYYLSLVSVLDRELPRAVMDAIESAGDISFSLIGAHVNILFFSSDRSEVRKLLDGFGWIGDMDIPTQATNYSQGTNTLATQPVDHLLFEIAREDTNGDGRINGKDRSAYYLSDFSGANLRQITPDSIKFDRHWYSLNNEVIFFEEVKIGPKENVYGVEYTLDERRLYYFDIAKDQFEPFYELQTVFQEVMTEFKRRVVP